MKCFCSLLLGLFFGSWNSVKIEGQLSIWRRYFYIIDLYCLSHLSKLTFSYFVLSSQLKDFSHHKSYALSTFIMLLLTFCWFPHPKHQLFLEFLVIPLQMVDIFLVLSCFLFERSILIYQSQHISTYLLIVQKQLFVFLLKSLYLSFQSCDCSQILIFVLFRCVRNCAFLTGD